MAACRATLETAELLENIIIKLPPAAIQKVKRVSKTWYDLIANSKRLRLAGCIRTIKRDSSNPLFYIHPQIPFYPEGSGLRMHPSKNRITTKPPAHFICHLTIDNLHLLEYDTAFATMPPCTAIAGLVQGSRLRAGFPPKRSVFCCTVYVMGGVRIRDVTEVAVKMWQQEFIHLPMSELDAYTEFEEAGLRGYPLGERGRTQVRRHFCQSQRQDMCG